MTVPGLPSGTSTATAIRMLSLRVSATTWRAPWCSSTTARASSRSARGSSTRRVVPCLGDIDNDGDLDLWLGRAGQDLLFLNDGKGKFTQAPAAARARRASI